MFVFPMWMFILMAVIEGALLKIHGYICGNRCLYKPLHKLWGG